MLRNRFCSPEEMLSELIELIWLEGQVFFAWQRGVIPDEVFREYGKYHQIEVRRITRLIK